MNIPAYITGHGRIARGTWLYRTAMIGALCAAFGSLGQNLFGDMGALPFAIAFVWCGFALAAKRLHDLDRSGWWLAVLLVPLLGVVWLFMLLCRRGSEGRNRYGAEPLVRKDYLQVNIGG